MQFPPGPRGWLGPTLKLTYRPIESLSEWREQYGDTFLVRRLNQRIVITCDPELVRKLHSGSPSLFAAAVPPEVDVLLGQHSLFLLYGDERQRERKVINPSFRSDKVIEWAPAVVEATRVGLERNGQTDVNMLERSAHITLDVISRIVFGLDDQERRTKAITLLHEWATAVRPGFLFFRALQREFWGISNFARFQRLTNEMEALFVEEINSARNSDLHARQDILSVLVHLKYDDGSRMADDVIISHLKTLVFAGHETTATTVAWAVYFILKEPKVYKRVLEECATAGSPHELARNAYLEAIFEETLRLRPVTVDVFRVLRQPWVFGDWNMPAGTAISACAALVHYSEELWPDPECFRPERFLGNRPKPETYIPFGGGLHRCIGASLAKVEACAILGTIFSEYEVKLSDPEAEIRWSRGLGALQPLGGIPVKLRSRKM